MKKPTYSSLRWHAKRRLKQYKKRHGRRDNFISVVSADGQTIAKASKTSPIPEVMCFDRAPEETLEEIQRITQGREIFIGRLIGKRIRQKSKHFRGRKRRLGTYRPFENVKYISTSAAIVMAASFEKLRLETEYRPYVVNVKRWEPGVFF